ncbi:MAG: hypothetical protein ACLSVD_15495 [Eggerthellaceae bacterium]
MDRRCGRRPSCAERDELAFLLGEPTFFLFSSTADLEAFEGASADSGGSSATCRGGDVRRRA